jgi:hypothetical protein
MLVQMAEVEEKRKAVRVIQKCSCERWYDGTWWEAEAPDNWCFHRDMGIKNFPYVFRSPRGSQLTVWESKNVQVNRPAWAPSLPAGLKMAAERVAFQLAESSSWNVGAGDLLRRELGLLTGFTHGVGAPPAAGWDGFFVAEPWMIHARLESTIDAFIEDERSALAIIESIHFFC